MYLGIDIGGTKTLIATLTNEGVITEELKFPTPKNYDEFLKELEANLDNIKEKNFKACGIAMPATSIDREHGIGKAFGNLPWINAPIQHDVTAILKCPIVVENDAKLAALSEAMLLKDRFKTVLYVTVSTGIGYGLVKSGVIDTTVGDGGGRTILLEHNGKMMPWEDFASGRAIVERYGKKAMDIKDEPTWKKISSDLAKGFIELIAVTQPEVIVIGGGVGNYFDRFSKFLKDDIDKYAIPIIDMPLLIEAKRPDEAVVYGCYDLAKQVYSNA